ncbi:hypothetical protein [Bernardetia sp.]|uniref:hypothetical protein n=1 Tax=Bernardetia sp. TaxID=1937974 RepID=UPI0025C6FC15|nr:hypothetical protein [Bernardetia sp.]
MKKAFGILATLFFFAFCIQQYKIHSLGKKMERLVKKVEISQEQQNLDSKINTTSEEDKEHYELAIAMARMQGYMQKLHFAGEHQNWKLAQFYTHELEETMEDIIDHKVMDDGKNISSLVKTMAFPNIEKLEKTIKSEDKASFVEGYQLLLRSCNNCHVASNHQFIKITTPKNADVINQDFK